MQHSPFNFNTKLLAGAMLIGLAAMGSAASAQSTLVGGGATLPAVGYVGDVTSHKRATPTDGSLFYAYSQESGNPAVSYCQSGSGTGKDVLSGAKNVQDACPDTGSIAGFDASAAGRSDLTMANIVGADSPLSQSNYQTYNDNNEPGQPVQFPAVAGAIAVIYNNPDVGTLNLTENQVCEIFSGQITDWRQLDSSIPGTDPRPINIVYRSDGSGTSFAFSNHLSAICGAATGGLNIATQFKTSENYSAAAASYLSSYASSSSAQGNPGVVDEILAHTDSNGNADSIGYGEVANAATALASTANISRTDAPSTFLDPNDFGSSPVAVDVTYGKVIATALNPNGRPVLDSMDPVPAHPECVALVDPSDYANPSAGYPIVAVSYLLGHSQGNGADLTATQGLLSAPYDTSIRSNVFTMGVSFSGLAYVSNADFTVPSGGHFSSKVSGCLVN